MPEAEEPITEEQVAEANADTEPVSDTEREHDDDPGEDQGPAVSDFAPEDSSARMEEIGKKLDALVKHGARRMGEIMGEDAQFYRPCLCTECFGTPGWLPPIDPTPDAQAFMYQWLGQRSGGELVPDPYSKACEVCGGNGALANHSKQPDAAPLPCPDCESRGWTAVGTRRLPGGLTTGNGPLPATPAEAIAPPADPSEYDKLTVADFKARGGVAVPPYVPAG